MSEQDWNTVTFSKRPAKASASANKQQYNQAVREGGQIESTKKYTGGKNTSVAGTGAGANAAKLDAETEELKHQKVDLSLSRSIMQARTAKKMTQDALAKALNMDKKIIMEYENGKAIPNGQVIAKIERALGTKLPRPPKK